MGKPEISISDSTMKSYVTTAERLIARMVKWVIRNHGPESVNEYGELDPGQVATIFSLWAKEGFFSAATIRQYRSALIFYYSRRGDQEAMEAVGILESTKESEHGAPPFASTSSRKAKSVSIEDWARLSRALSESSRKWGRMSMLWFSCSMLTGLRPCEWESAVIRKVSGKTVLNVRNAKNTNGRAHGDNRTIFLDHLSESEVDDLNMFMSLLHEHSEGIGFAAVYRAVLNAFNYANRIAFRSDKRRISLYTARHQFAANAKASGKSLKEIAALMGHASDETATTHYGKKRCGRFVPGLRASPAEVARVRSSRKPASSRSDQAVE